MEGLGGHMPGTLTMAVGLAAFGSLCMLSDPPCTLQSVPYRAVGATDTDRLPPPPLAQCPPSPLPVPDCPGCYEQAPPSNRISTTSMYP